MLSETIERIDRREKLYAYTSIPSLREYLIAAQDCRQVDVYRRAETDWVHETCADGAVPLGSLDMDLALDSIYEDVEQP